MLLLLDILNLEAIEKWEDVVGLMEIIVNCLRQFSGFAKAGSCIPMLTKNQVSMMSSIK